MLGSDPIPDIVRLSRGCAVRVTTLNAEHGNDQGALGIGAVSAHVPEPVAFVAARFACISRSNDSTAFLQTQTLPLNALDRHN